MNREQDLTRRERAAREAWAHGGTSDADIAGFRLATADAREDWPLLTVMLAGLMLALIANTFVGLMPV